nr:MAG TPA: hypothetical protein [Caudoviricetes sp.]
MPTSFELLMCAQKKQSANWKRNFTFILKVKNLSTQHGRCQGTSLAASLCGGRASRGETVVKNSKKWGW